VAARDAARRNLFVGDFEAVRLRDHLAAMAPEAPAIDRWSVHWQLGEAELRLGAPTALRHFDTALAMLDELGDMAPPGDAERLLYRAAVAYLRKGELDNCTHHNAPESCILPLRGDALHRDRQGSERAIELLDEVLGRVERGSAIELRARWLLNLAWMTLGGYPGEIAAAHLVPPESFASTVEIARFANRAPALGLDTFDLSGGAIADDFDGDGDLDLMVSTSDPSGPMHYFENLGAGAFRERTAEVGLEGLLGGLNMEQADYDNDGDLDILVLRGAWQFEEGRVPNSLLRNDEGVFNDVTFAAGLGERHYPTQTGAWADYDNDGDLDLYVGNESSDRLRAPGQLFRNRGDGTFVDVSAEAGVENFRFAKGVSWGDYDDDGDPDLYVSNLDADNRLYRNLGDGTFVDVATEAGCTGPQGSFPAWFWDFDNDGVLDLFVASYGEDLAQIVASHLGLETPAEPPALYRGRGDGTFEDVAREAGLTRFWPVMGANFGDLDSDGFLDMYLGTGAPDFDIQLPNVMLLNRAGRSFADVTETGGFGHLQKGHAVLFADLDDDGDNDVFAQMGGAFLDDRYGNALFDNPGLGDRHLTVELIGERSNRSAIGARIRADFVDRGERRSIYRQVSSGGSFGASPLRQRLGLGGATSVERLEISWPTTGEVETFTDIAVGRTVRLVEGAGELTDLAPRR
jgi:hypothetical protein